MKLAILAIGRLKAGPEKLLADEYLTRIEGLGRKLGISGIKISEISESQKPTTSGRKEEEARYLASVLPRAATIIVLDQRGRSLTSTEFANLLRKYMESGISDLAFLIGGPDGHAEPTKTQTAHLLSFGPMTWPHRLVRVMLLEQLYRAMTIMAGHPYHRP